MKVLVFGASNSSTSINKKFAVSTSKYYKEDEVRVLDLNDFEMPIYGVDRQAADGIPGLASDFAQQLDWADLIIISFAEHNGNYTIAYKNIIDWVSRIRGRRPYQDKHVFLLSTSAGARGGQSVLDIATQRMPFDGATVLDTFSLPEFEKNFEDGKGLTNPLLRSQLEAKVRKTKREMAKILTNRTQIEE